MKIYFEDGELMREVQTAIGALFRVDGALGFSRNKEVLDIYNEYYKNTGKDVIIYTNSLVALSNKYCWNDDLKVPELYIRPGAGRKDFVRVDKLTNRALRQAHNLRKMYMANEFGNL